jgi:hypothetical protein
MAKISTSQLPSLEAVQAELARRDYSRFAAQNIRIVDKNGEKVPFVHNNIQGRINQTVKELRYAGKPVRIIVLKARQEGVSTNEQGRMIYNTTTKANRTGLIVAQDAPTTAKIFDKARYMYNSLPPAWQPLTRASNARELIFDTPTGYKGKEIGLNSRISIQVAGDVVIGRGDTLYYVHLSEFAFWASPEGKNPMKQLAGILQAVPKLPETEVVIESTANGFNDFKDLWDGAVSGENGWTPLFFAWFDNPEYAMKGDPITYSEYEQKLVDTYGLSEDQIRWYRWTLKNDCLNDVQMMYQENPSFPDEAFIGSGACIFDQNKIIQRKAVLERKYKDNPPTKGEFIITWHDAETMDYPTAYQWVSRPTGCIKIYEQPKAGHPYTLGGDTKGEGSDRFAGTVINNNTGNRCASLHGEMSSKVYTAQMWALGMYYNTALVGIETNFNTYPIELLTDWHYPRQYQREKTDTFTGEVKKAYGWKTDGNTRPLIIEREITLVNENIECIQDVECLSEMLTFIKDKDGRPDAQSGKHDDLLFSEMIAEGIRDQQTRVVEVIQTVEDDDDEDDRRTDDNWFN